MVKKIFQKVVKGLLYDGLFVDLCNVAVHGYCGTELFLAVRAREMLSFLVLMEHDLILEDLVAIVTEWLQIREVTLFSAHGKSFSSSSAENGW